MPTNSERSSLPALYDLSGRVAVVTGGIGLLGTEFCLTLAEAGAKVVIADLNEAAAHRFAYELGRVEPVFFTGEPVFFTGDSPQQPTALAVKTDVTDPESVQHMVALVMQTYGRLDILVNSAALDPKMDPQSMDTKNALTFEDFPLDAWNQALAVNLTGAFLCCQAAVRPMLAQGKGVIINLCSIYGIVAPDQRLYQTITSTQQLAVSDQQPAVSNQQYKPVYYTVTKEGILGLTKYLAAYYAGKNIRVNALSPGGVYNGHEEEFVKAYSAKAVLGRMANKSDMNGALLFLASDASAYMTGSNLVVDGGWTVW
jgi:NAD(P)-dependent dehydrogenase (short-subunit alcohol dehydrogenase family)